MGVNQVHILKKLACFFHCSTFSQNPWDQFELSDIVFPLYRLLVAGISNEIKAGDSKTISH